MECADFFHVDTNLGKLKDTLIIIGWAQSKMGETFRSWDYKIKYISQMN